MHLNEIIDVIQDEKCLLKKNLEDFRQRLENSENQMNYLQAEKVF